jgi:hypothetical protein
MEGVILGQILKYWTRRKLFISFVRTNVTENEGRGAGGDKGRRLSGNILQNRRCQQTRRRRRVLRLIYIGVVCGIVVGKNARDSNLTCTIFGIFGDVTTNSMVSLYCHNNKGAKESTVSVTAASGFYNDHAANYANVNES